MDERSVLLKTKQQNPPKTYWYISKINSVNEEVNRLLPAKSSAKVGYPFKPLVSSAGEGLLPALATLC